jgi:type II secretory pathway component GspD/PulD (secretin)
MKQTLTALFLTVGLLLPGCSSYYQDEVRAPSDQAVEDARTGQDLKPRTRLLDGVFHMQRVQHGSMVRVRENIVLKKPDLPPFDIAYISRDLESVLLELANAAGESIVIPQGLRGRKVTLIHSGADFRQMLNLVLAKAGYHYNYVEGVWYITRYPIRNYILELSQSKRKGGLVGKTELVADESSTNSGGSNLSTDYSDQVWGQVKETVSELIKVGENDLKSSQNVSAEGLSGTGQILTEGQRPQEEILPPPVVLDGADEEEQIFGVITAEGGVRPVQIDQPESTDHLVPEEAASPWFKITETAGLITVRAAPEAHRQIEQYLEEVQEAAHRQIVVEARVVALIRSKTTNRGVQLSGSFDKDSVLGGIFGFTPASQLTAGSLSGGFFELRASPNNTQDLTALVQSLSTLGDIYTLSSPTILARNNQISRVSITRQLGFVETEVETATGTTGDVKIGSRVDRARFKNAGTVMSVMPFIGRNKVQLQFRLSVATKSSDTRVLTSIGNATPVENLVPNLANNLIDQDMVLEYGRVYAIGGLIETSTNVDASYDPTLSQIPGMQEIFSRAKNNKQDTEFIVLIRVSRS